LTTLVLQRGKKYSLSGMSFEFTSLSFNIDLCRTSDCYIDDFKMCFMYLRWLSISNDIADMEFSFILRIGDAWFTTAIIGDADGGIGDV
jgi:hypothetical protein